MVSLLYTYFERDTIARNYNKPNARAPLTHFITCTGSELFTSVFTILRGRIVIIFVSQPKTRAKKLVHIFPSVSIRSKIEPNQQEMTKNNKIYIFQQRTTKINTFRECDLRAVRAPYMINITSNGRYREYKISHYEQHPTCESKFY